MKNILFIMLMINVNLYSQHQELILLSQGDLPIDSNLTSVQYELFGPKNIYCYEESINSPLFVVFDKQNELGYNQILSNINLMVSLGNIPSSSVLGISFTESNRKKLTMYNPEGGRMDDFMRELIKLIDSLRGENSNSPVILVGHSRTAYLSIQLLLNYSNKINGVFASSPWNFNEKEKSLYLKFINTLDKKRYLYANSGSGELLDNEISFNHLSSFLESNKSQFVESSFTVNKCDHILSRNIDFIKNSTDFFYHYQLSLMKSLSLFDNGCFKKDSINKILNYGSNASGYKIYIDEVFIFSAYSSLISNLESKKIKNEDILDFLCLAKSYSNSINDPFVLFIIADCYQEIGNIKERDKYIVKAIESSEKYLWESEDEKDSFFLELNQQFNIITDSFMNKNVFKKED